MTMTRRDLVALGKLGILAALFPLSSCWFQNIYSDIDRYVRVALLAFDRIIAILAEHGIVVEGLDRSINAVKAALADIETAVLEYRDAAAHEKATLVAAIATALKIAAERLQAFWELLKMKIPNVQLATVIKTLLDIIISTLIAFAEKLQTGGAPAVPRNQLLAQPRIRTLTQFRAEFNGVLRQSGEGKFAI